MFFLYIHLTKLSLPEGLTLNALSLLLLSRTLRREGRLLKAPDLILRMLLSDRSTVVRFTKLLKVDSGIS